jgi:hypothetical protein
MKKQNGFATVVGLVVFAVWLVAAGGWVWNIVKLVESDFVWSGLLIARAVGIIVAPLGAVLGFL